MILVILPELWLHLHIYIFAILQIVAKILKLALLSSGQYRFLYKNKDPQTPGLRSQALNLIKEKRN